LFNEPGGVVEPAVQRTKCATVSTQFQRTGRYSTHGIYDLHDVIDGQIVRGTRQDESSMQPALRPDEARAPQLLQYFCQVTDWHTRSAGDIAGDDGLTIAGGEEHDDAQCVLSGL
jgi:hypothetical protein